MVAGQILTNVLTVLALVYTIDGLLTYIGKGFAIHHLTLDLIFGYLFYPLTFLMGQFCTPLTFVGFHSTDLGLIA